MTHALKVMIVSFALIAVLPAYAADKTATCECKDALKVTVRKAGEAGDRAAAAVSVVDFSFNSGALTITAGDTVTWTNNGGAPHTVTSDVTGIFDSGTLNPGQTFSFTFNTAGSFQYHCSIHPNMTGTVTVNAATTGGSGSVDVSGSWTGKGKGKAFNLTGTDPKGANENQTITANLTQSGGTLTGTISFTGGAGNDTYTITGQVGNGSFWASGPNGSSTLTLTVSGHVSKKGDQIKATAFVYGGPFVDEIKFSLKK